MKALTKDILAGLCAFAAMLSMYVVVAVFGISTTRGNRALGWVCIIAVAILMDRVIEGREG